MQGTVKNNFEHNAWNLPEPTKCWCGLLTYLTLKPFYKEASYVSFNVYMWGNFVLTEL